MNADNDLVQEKIAMDILTSSMYSLNFLKNITTAIFDPKLESLTVRELYAQWLRKAGFSEAYEAPHIPYSFGAIIGYLYCGVLLAKERWIDLLPDETVDVASPDWGFSDITYSAPKEPSPPSIKYVFRRMRNALGHGRILIDVPVDINRDEKDKDDFEKKVTLKLHDEDPKNTTNTFDISISLYGLATAIKKFHSIAYAHVTAKC